MLYCPFWTVTWFKKGSGALSLGKKLARSLENMVRVNFIMLGLSDVRHQHIERVSVNVHMQVCTDTPMELMPQTLAEQQYTGVDILHLLTFR